MPDKPENRGIHLVEKWDTQRVLVLKLYEVVEAAPEKPIGISLKVKDGNKECWMDAREFIPLGDDTRFLYEEFTIKAAQIETLKKDLKKIFDELRKMSQIKNKHSNKG